MDKDKPAIPSSNFSLEYETQEGQNYQVSKAADPTIDMRIQGGSTVQSALNQPPSESVFNIHLNYDPNQALDPKSWDSNFHAISLYSFMEHLASDTLNVKESLIRMKKYISGKSIDSTKANEVKDLRGIGEALWEFINAVYKSQWDSFFVENNTTFRSKVKVKFNPQPRKSPLPSNNKDAVKPTYVSPMPPPIPAKMSKKVKEISKYFKKTENLTSKKSYAQASSNLINNNNTSSVAMNTLKIKKVFPKLSNKKIDSIQKVINEDDAKPKLRINMTTKGPSRKQIIIPMTNELGKRFTKDLASHITNINHILKNIKSNICADYISSDNKGVNIVTNNIASSSNLQEIEKYIKQFLDDNSNSIVTPRLPQSKSYLKIVGIPYYVDKLSTRIITENIERILKNTHIFNKIVLASRPRIIKVLPKSDMAIVWIDIWDNQNGNNAKKIINR